MSDFPIPAASEPALKNLGATARLATIIDLLVESVNGTGGTSSAKLNATSGNVANATAAAVLAADAAKTTYIEGFDISGTGATTAAGVTVTVSDGTWTFDYTYAATAGALVSNQPLIIKFPRPIAASAINTAITVSCPALGAGNTHNTVNAYGFQL